MPVNSGRPIIGRLASAGLGFLSSTAGFPVAGSIGLLSQTMTPQMPPPHLLTRTLASPAWVSQIPLTSPPACALRRRRAKQRRQNRDQCHRSRKSAFESHGNLKAFNPKRLESKQLNISNKANLCNAAGDLRMAAFRCRLCRSSPGQAAQVDDAVAGGAPLEVVDVGRDRLETNAALGLIGIDFAVERFPAAAHVKRRVVRFAKQQREMRRSLRPSGSGSPHRARCWHSRGAGVGEGGDAADAAGRHLAPVPCDLAAIDADMAEHASPLHPAPAPAIRHGQRRCRPRAASRRHPAARPRRYSGLASGQEASPFKTSISMLIVFVPAINGARVQSGSGFQHVDRRFPNCGV